MEKVFDKIEVYWQKKDLWLGLFKKNKKQIYIEVKFASYKVKRLLEGFWCWCTVWSGVQEGYFQLEEVTYSASGKDL